MELSREARSKAVVQLNYVLRIIGDNRTFNDNLYRQGSITGEDVLALGSIYSELSEIITDMRKDVEEE